MVIIISVITRLSVILYASLRFFTLEGSISFFTLSTEKFTAELSVCQLSKQITYFRLFLILLSTFIVHFSLFHTTIIPAELHELAETDLLSEEQIIQQPQPSCRTESETFVYSPANANITPYLLILTGIATLAKSAQIPLHTASTPVSSLVYSSTLNLTCYISYSIYVECVRGYLTSPYFRLIAFYEKDLKNILAYSTIYQSALLIFIISTNLKVLILMHIIIHALAIALLFIRIIIFTIFIFGNLESPYLLLRSYNNNTISSKILYILLYINALLLRLALFNG
ncbi:Oxidored q1 domain containing protein [Trichuris trichiura]|uniref:NADH dehydrogenase subunit 5 n=1 Tax=Trichuris trichiura TaxID=36087 RepID=A0A077ZIG1_TRITR|nr:Oxidored q1 domain containing protein [Trichuris trichiura]